jgi:DNA-binding NtrC family response regulator
MRSILTGVGFRVTGRLSPLQVLRDVKKKSYDLLITTLVMRELGGFELIRGVRNSGSNVPIMMITGYGGEQAAIEATRLGASDYMNKPVAPEELIARVRRIIQPATTPLNTPAPTQIDELITQDQAMESMLELVRTVASSSSRVLITGETGTGKQLIARMIHNRSPRKNAPFVDINCAAIPDTLLESELFGHERGAFTGADQRRIGRFEEAGKGTIFLDEIGEISYAVQAKLLKVLQDGQFNRVGGQQMLQSNARVIAATNRDLEKESAEGRFRLDLFYRLQVVTVPLPPLRKRQGDVPLLADFFLKMFSAVPGQQFSPEAMRALTHYAWPGNVRELENMVEHVAVLNKSPLIPITALPERLLQQSLGYIAPVAPYRGKFAEAKQQFERDYVIYVLGQARGNMAEAARLAGMDRSQFFRLVRKLELNPRDFLEAATVDKTSSKSI